MSVEKAIIVGAGHGLSASLARLLSKSGFDLVLASRNVEKNYNLAKETNAKLEECDVTSIQQVENLFKKADDILGTPDLVIFNPSARLRGTVEELDMRADLGLAAMQRLFLWKALLICPTLHFHPSLFLSYHSLSSFYHTR